MTWSATNNVYEIEARESTVDLGPRSALWPILARIHTAQGKEIASLASGERGLFPSIQFR